MKQEDEKYEN